MAKEPIAKALAIDPTELHAYSTGLLQGKAYRTLADHLTKALIVHDLSIPEWKMLGQLHERGAMRLVTLADILDVRPPLITKMVDALEKRELVQRVPDPEDSRARIISATKKGRSIVAPAEKDVKRVMGRLLQGISRQELLVYLKVLTKIVDNG